MPATMLTDTVRAHFNASDTDELLLRFIQNEYTKDMLTSLPAKLFQCYSAHDRVSQVLVDNMADELAAHAIAAVRNLRIEHSCPDIAISGGMLKSAPRAIVDKISSRIENEIPQFHLYFSRYEPVIGALKMGIIHLGSDFGTNNLYDNAENLRSMLREA